MKTGIILGLIFIFFLIYKVIKRRKKIKAWYRHWMWLPLDDDDIQYLQKEKEKNCFLKEFFPLGYIPKKKETLNKGLEEKSEISVDTSYLAEDDKSDTPDWLYEHVEKMGEDIKKVKEEPFKISKEEVLRKISEMFPKADLVSLNYMGSGDDFEEFSNLSIEIELDKPIEHKNGQIQKYEIEYITDYKEIEKFVNLEVSDGNKIESYIWEVFKKANNSPTFVDAGSHGTISFYIKNNSVELQNNYWEYNYDDDGNIDWGQEEDEIECEEEKF